MKHYERPEMEIFDILPSVYCGSKPNDKWTYDDDGNLVNPGGKTPPGHNHHSNEYRNSLWNEN